MTRSFSQHGTNITLTENQPLPGTIESATMDGNTTTTTNTAEVSVESLRLQFSAAIVRIHHHVSIETIRPLTVFLGLQNANHIDDDDTTSTEAFGAERMPTIAPNAYSTPNGSTYRRTYEMIQLRVQDNLSYYLSNYAFIVVMTSIVVVLMHPSMIVTGLLVYGLFLGHTYLIRHEVILWGNVSIQTILTVQQRLYLFGSIGLLLILVTCVVPTLIIMTISSMIILTHAILRNNHQSLLSSSSQRGESDKQQHSINHNEADPLLSAP
jgi:PRA1 family protein